MIKCEIIVVHSVNNLMNYSKRRVRNLTPERKRKYNPETAYMEKYTCLFIFIFILLVFFKIIAFD